MSDTDPALDQASGGPPWDVEDAVRRRYSAASQQVVPELCCPVDYRSELLEVLPQELIQRDYGCGDPSRWVRPGETVLDLGSGGGKICFIASQVVGAKGRVIGVDLTDEMLALARRYQQQIGESIGYHNTEFHKGRIQDLALDLDVMEDYLAKNPIRGANDWLAAEAHAEQLRRTKPMIADDTIDCIVSNCVLNLVREADRRELFAGMLRVLKPGGRAVISDITSDRPIPEPLKQNAELWSGCLSGAYLEWQFMQMFTDAGFFGVEMVDRQQRPWTVIEGIEFRSVTVQAFKPPRHQEVLLQTTEGPVTDGPCCGPARCC